MEEAHTTMTRGLSMSEDSSANPTGLPHHKNAWTQHELLGSTLQSYFTVLRKTAVGGPHGLLRLVRMMFTAI